MTGLVEAYFDASPWGYGGFVAFRGVPIGWFAEEVTAEDEAFPGVIRGDCRTQGLAEALAVLVGIRLWTPVWRSKPLVVQLRSDSMTALAALGKLKTRSSKINAI
eukprot:620032-Amphidinium_carterae.1